MDKKLLVKDWIKKYPYLEKIAQYTIFEEKEIFEELRNSNTLNVNGTEVNKDFLNKILSDEKYYNYTQKYFKNEIGNFNVSYIIDGDIGDIITYTKVQIVNGLHLLIENYKYKYDEKQINKYNMLYDLIKFDKFVKEKINDTFEISIDLINYSIPVRQIIKLIMLPILEFDKFCKENKYIEYGDISKEHLIYAVLEYFKEYKIFDNYILENDIKKRMNELTEMQIIDCESLNKLLETKDVKFKKINIDTNLKKEILNEMPTELDILEKSIYIYIKMCKLLTYDDEYYVANQKGKIAEKHKQISNVMKINLENNKIVCFEFNLIYSFLLNELGIKFCSKYKNHIGEAYGHGHVNIEFRVGKYLVLADSVTSILQGDIMQAKLNQPLRGIKCFNKNKNTKESFSKKLHNVYKILALKEGKKQVEHIENFGEIVSQFKFSPEEKISINERIHILINKVNSSKLVGIDALSYVLQLREILFTIEEQNNNFEVSIIRNNKPIEKTKKIEVCAIFTVNNSNYNTYYCYIPQQNFYSITKKKLKKLFNKKDFEYFDAEEPQIPNL